MNDIDKKVDALLVENGVDSLPKQKQIPLIKRSKFLIVGFVLIVSALVVVAGIIPHFFQVSTETDIASPILCDSEQWVLDLEYSSQSDYMLIQMENRAPDDIDVTANFDIKYSNDGGTTWTNFDGIGIEVGVTEDVSYFMADELAFPNASTWKEYLTEYADWCDWLVTSMDIDIYNHEGNSVHLMSDLPEVIIDWSNGEFSIDEVFPGETTTWYAIKIETGPTLESGKYQFNLELIPTS